MAGKVALINPPSLDGKVWVRDGRCQQWDIWGAPFPPYSLAMISSQLKNVGMETLIIDSGVNNKNPDEVLAECRQFKPDLVILSAASPTIQADLGHFAPALKSAVPSTKIGAIGIHVSRFPSEALGSYPALDVAIIGEPELTSRELAFAVMERRVDGSLRGIAWKNDRGEIRINPEREFCDDLDSLGFPDWEALDLTRYRMPIKHRPFSLVGFSRGCPFRCRFCATHPYWGDQLRTRSVQSVIDEIEFNLSLGVRDFLFWTELMTLDQNFLESFLDALIREGLHRRIQWVCNSRVDAGDRKLFSRMKSAGCWQIAFGFEFGSNEILARAGKGGRATIERGRAAAEMANDSGLVVSGHFILGYPGETAGDLQKTIDFACSLPLTFAHFYAATPFPGSSLYDEAVQKGWLNETPFSRISQDETVINTETLDAETANRLREKAYRSFYLRPRSVIRLLSVPENALEFFHLMKAGVRHYRSMKE